MNNLFKHLSAIAQPSHQSKTRHYYRHLLSLLGVLVAPYAVFYSLPASAQVIDSFTPPLFNTKVRGDIQIVGNTLLTCNPSGTNGASCSTARNSFTGTPTPRNDTYNMIYVDVDGDSTTFNSSTANLTLPAGATVLRAYLFWGAVSNNATRTQVLFRTPATAGYNTINGSLVAATNANFGSGSTSSESYQAFADVTSLVQAGGTGTYGIANVQAIQGGPSTGSAAPYGGWSLVIVYEAPNEKPRDLSVFGGLARVQQANSQVSIDITGFTTPPFGAVNARVGVVAYDGDATGTGDSLSLQRTVSPLNTTTLTNSLNPSNDFFNSTITRLGSHLTDKNPNYLNQLGGVDIDIFDNNTVLQNGDTSLRLNLTTSTSAGETYFPGVVTTAIDLFIPVLVLDKTFIDVNGGNVEPGDILEYTVTVTNNRDANGNGDPANNNVLTDPIPANSTYVPGSLVIDGVAKTDAASDDQAEYDSSNNRAIFRLGASATVTQGGTLQVNTNSAPNPPTAGSSSTVKFRVRVNPSVPDGTLIVNQAEETFTGQTLGQGSTLDAATPTVIIETQNPSISGTLYEDSDGGDDFDSGETPLPAGIGVTLYQDSNNNNIIDSGEQIATVNTDSNGNYTFLDIPNGTYKIQVDPTDPQIPNGYVLGTPNNLVATVAGLPVTGQNFGFDVPASNPNLLLVKRITKVDGSTTTIGGDDLAIYNNTSSPYDDNVDQTPPFTGVPDPNQDDTTNWPNLNTFLIGGTNGGQLQPKKEIEYTIYFLSAGNNAAQNVQLCDRIPQNQTFVPTAYNGEPQSIGGLTTVDRGIAIFYNNSLLSYTNVSDGDIAQFYAPGETLPAVCGAEANTTGAIVVDLGNLPQATSPGAPPTSYGFVRFTAIVN